MRLSTLLTTCLIWIGALTFMSDLKASDLLMSEQGTNEQPADVVQGDTKQTAPLLDQAAVWIWVKQREYHRALTRELRKMRGKDGVGWALVLMSFFYGVFHAAGPGHGKAVLATYLLTHRNELNRGIAMGAAASLLQGVTALLLVYGLIGLAGWLPRETQTATLWVTRVSFTLLASIGLYLFVRSAVNFFTSFLQWHNQANVHHHDHSERAHGEGCGCKHVPSAAEIKIAGNRRAIAGVVLAIGLRPCSGAVLVLILASVMGLALHGAIAVLAMTLGTSITVVTLAIFAVKARDWASTLITHPSVLWKMAADSIGVLGGTLLLLLGGWLLYTSFVLKPAIGL